MGNPTPAALPESSYRDRLVRVQRRLRRKGIDALLVAQPENRRYLSGYKAPDHGIGESSGVLFIPARGESRLLTDFRYKLQAEQESCLDVSLYPRGLLAVLKTMLPEYAVKRFGFESHYTLHSFSLKLAGLAREQGCELVPLDNLVERLRLVKSEEEIALIRRSVERNEAVFASVFERLHPKMSEIEISIMIETAMREQGAERPGFATIVAAGGNSALPHAVPTETPVGRNRSITIDMGLVLDGYCSDMTRNFVIGTADARYLDLHRLVLAAQKAGIAAVQAGRTMKEVDRAARSVIEAGGHGGHFGHALGHGVGLAVHEAPRVSARSRQKLRAGMVITVEPGIYIPGWGGIRLENMVVVREHGCDVLNRNTTWLDP